MPILSVSLRISPNEIITFRHNFNRRLKVKINVHFEDYYGSINSKRMRTCLSYLFSIRVVGFKRIIIIILWCLNWEEGKPLTWDVTVVCPLADSYVATAACVAGSVDEWGSCSS